MPNLPYKFLLLVAMGVLFFMYGLPKRANLFSLLLHPNTSKEAQMDGQEQKIRQLAIKKIEAEICSMSDYCKYRPIKWSNFYKEDSVSVSIIHEFYSDETKRKFIFRMRYGQLSEVNNIY